MEQKQLKSFRDLMVWQKAADLATLIYASTENFPHAELYGLTNQMRRSSVSISSNIAEGFKRSHRKEKLQFYNIAYGSVAELESQTEIAKKLNFLESEEYQKLTSALIEIGKMIDGLIKSTNKSTNSLMLNSALLSVFLYSIFYILNPVIVSGANFFIESESGNFSVDRSNTIRVYLDTKGETINTISGKLIFDSELISVEELRDGNSIINFWIEKPREIVEERQETGDKRRGEIVFSGIVPSGINLPKNFIFEMIVRPKDVGSGNIRFEDLIVLKHDGLGTSLSSSQTDFTFEVASFAESDEMERRVDYTIPERFIPIITKNENIFDGKYFVTFATQDKGSGISHYEVKEGFWGKFREAESPHKLRNQFVIGDIYVKAVDNEGNYIIAKSEFSAWTLRYQNNLVFSIICLYILFLLYKKGLCKKIYLKIFKKRL